MHLHFCKKNTVSLCILIAIISLLVNSSLGFHSHNGMNQYIHRHSNVLIQTKTTNKLQYQSVKKSMNSNSFHKHIIGKTLFEEILKSFPKKHPGHKKIFVTKSIITLINSNYDNKIHFFATSSHFLKTTFLYPLGSPLIVHNNSPPIS